MQKSQWYPQLRWNTLVDLVASRAEIAPECRAFTFLDNGEAEGATRTYSELHCNARAIGAHLQTQCQPGDRALLLYAAGLDFVDAFLGCLFGGVVAVPAYPPDPARLQRTLPRLLAIAKDAEVSTILTTSKILSLTQALFPVAPDLAEKKWIATDAINAQERRALIPAPITAESLAFLQYTSGSTSDPKGVMVSQRNLLHNLTMIQRAFEMGEGEPVVSWLPLYHDMGLIGHVLTPLFLGGPCYLMSPLAFLKRPLRWLRAISRYRACTSTAPNFAYDLCVRKVVEEEKRELDLSSWHHALNGAEPVHPQTLERFARAFASSGFKREAFYPCYGLAEGTLVVSGAKVGSAPLEIIVESEALEKNRVRAARDSLKDQRRLVACGVNPSADQQVIIVDPQSRRRCPEDQIGEIWLAGPSVAQGYFNRLKETAEVFNARLAEDETAGPFLRTGDLGFIQEGALFVTGRVKDLIIVRGLNYYPQDIEWAAEAADPTVIRAGSSAAFATDHDGRQILIWVAEVQRRFSADSRALDAETVAQKVRQAVAQDNALHLHAVVFVKAGSNCKTSSGKIQRRACCRAFETGALEILGQSLLRSANDTPMLPRITEEAVGLALGSEL